MPGSGWLTALMFDEAVILFGKWADARLEERDERGLLTTTLDEILSDTPIEEANNLSEFADIPGALRVRGARSAIQVDEGSE